MADFHQRIGDGQEDQSYIFRPAHTAANQIMLAAAEFGEWTEDNDDRLTADTVTFNLAASQFMKSIAEAIREDRLVILDSPRQGRGIILTPAGHTHSIEKIPDAISDITIAEFNRRLADPQQWGSANAD